MASISSYQTVFKFRWACLCLLIVAGLTFAGPARSQQDVNPHANPNELVLAVGNNALNAVRNDADAQRGDLARIDALIDHYLLPYVNFDKTTRLAAGRHWLAASAKQRDELVEAFKGTLLRTYGGTLAKVDSIVALEVLPFRGDPQANDTVVRSSFTRRNGPPVRVDYRLEKTSEGWKIYDLSVEGIWLIQNYRNQFSQYISQHGIESLITTLQGKHN